MFIPHLPSSQLVDVQLEVVSFVIQECTHSLLIVHFLPSLFYLGIYRDRSLVYLCRSHCRQRYAFTHLETDPRERLLELVREIRIFVSRGSLGSRSVIRFAPRVSIAMTRLPTSSTIPIASLLSQTPSPLSFIFASHSRWPLPPRALPAASSDGLTISVLDSSFNPPHAAHQALSDLGNEMAQLLAFTVSNADKKLDESELYHRLEMIRALAVDMHEKRESRGGKWENVAVAVMDAPTFTKKSQVLNEEITKLLKEEHGVDEGEVPTPEFVFPVGELDSLLLFPDNPRS